MDWWFHWLFGLLLYSPQLDLLWFMVGNVVLDIFFILSFISVAGIKPRSLSSMRTFGSRANKTFFHKIGFATQSVPTLFVFLALSFVPNVALKSLFIGMVVHLVIDLATHKKEPNPIFYPFSNKKIETGFLTWDLRNWNLVRPGLQIMSVLLLLKYLIFGFII